MTARRLVPIGRAGALIDPPVTRPAILAWLKAGCDAAVRRDGRIYIDLDRLIAWRAANRLHPDGPRAGLRTGGRQPGQGRPRRDARNQNTPRGVLLPDTPTAPANTQAPATDPTPTTVAEIEALARRGELTLALLQRASVAIATLDKARRLEETSGRLVDADAVERALQDELAAVRARLHAVPPGVEKRILAAGMLDAAAAAGVRRMVLEELDAACQALSQMPRPWSAGPSPARSRSANASASRRGRRRTASSA